MIGAELTLSQKASFVPVWHVGMMNQSENEHQAFIIRQIDERSQLPHMLRASLRLVALLVQQLLIKI